MSLFALGMWCSLLAFTSTAYTQSNCTHRHAYTHPYHTEINSMRCMRKQIINSVGINDLCTFANFKLLRMFLIIYGNSLKWYNLLFYAIILFSMYSHCRSWYSTGFRKDINRVIIFQYFNVSTVISISVI